MEIYRDYASPQKNRDIALLKKVEATLERCLCQAQCSAADRRAYADQLVVKKWNSPLGTARPTIKTLLKTKNKKLRTCYTAQQSRSQTSRGEIFNQPAEQAEA